MNLSKIQIKNFRSIDYIEFIISKGHKIFVGKNESGKSNILKAMSFLNQDEVISPDDIREALPDESPIKESYIRFVFSFEETEIQKIVKNIEGLYDGKNKKEKIITFNTAKLSIEDFVRKHCTAVYKVDFLSQKKWHTYYTLPSGYAFIPDIISPKEFVENDSPSEANPKTYENFYLISKSNYKQEALENLKIEPGNITLFYDEIVGDCIRQKLEELHPEVLNWRYDEKYLLPPSITIDSFGSNPNSCIPLKNLFELAGIVNINEEINKAKKGSAVKFRNLLEKIADHGTKHFQGVWKEYKDVSFSLSQNGANIDCGIKEINHFTFQQRSDGFKRFISFLLILSANNKNKKLTNALILVDEPDVSLHPSGIRYLRDELKRIAKENILFASTHSIFMIDDDIQNHYIIEKKNEKTIIQIPDEHSISEEEVLHRAMGFSIYETFNKVNILFEGWRDKQLFKVAISKVPTSYKEIKELHKNIGLSHSTGVRQIKNVTPIFELGFRNVFIVSDDDSISIEKQKEYIKERGYGTWFRYSEVDPDCTAITGEDFIKLDLVKKAVSHLIQTYEILKGEPDLENLKKGVILNIDKWVAKNGVDLQKKNEIVNDFKSYIFQSLTSSSIKDDYYRFCLLLLKEVTKKN